MIGRALLAASLTIAAGAADGPRPLLRPTRDVEVVYSMVRGDQTVQERTSWQASTGLERLDSPIGGRPAYAIADQAAGTVQMVSDASKVVMTIRSPRGPLNGGPAIFRKAGQMTVAGLRCTEWDVTPPGAGAQSDQICVTDDGVLLNIRVGGVQRGSADSVRYAPLDPGLFRVPAEYRHVQPQEQITPPPAAR